MKDRLNWIVFLLILVIKTPVFLWMLSLDHHNAIPGLWGYTGTSDWTQYLKPIDNLVEKGKYSPDIRMPGYGLAILIPRMFFDRVTALNVLIIVQFLTAVASSYILAKISYLIFGLKRVFVLTACVYCVCASVSIWDTYILTESLSTSFLIFSFYYFLKSNKGNNYLNLFIAGIFICWALFIRPVSGILLVAMILNLFWQCRKKS